MPRQNASQTLIFGSPNSGQAISGLGFYSRNYDFALFFFLISGQGQKFTNISLFIGYFISNIDFSNFWTVKMTKKSMTMTKGMMNKSFFN